MINEYYSHSTYPSQGAAGSSAAARAEFELIETSLSAKMPDLSGNANKVVLIAPGADRMTTSAGTLSLPANLAISAFNLTLTLTAATSVTLPTSGRVYSTLVSSMSSAELLASLSDKTGTGVSVFATSPTLVTPNIGVATGTSLTLGGSLALSIGSISSGTGSLTFGTANLTTSGTLASGAITVSSDIVISTGSITSASGTISFSNENLTTTGTIASGTHTVSSTLILANGSITSTTGGISFDNENLTTTGTLGAGASTLGVTTVTTLNKLTVTAPATNATLTIAEGKTLTASNTLTFTGTDASSVAFGTGGTVLYNGGNLGTPLTATLTNATGLLIDTGTVGTLPVLRGGTGVTSSTGSVSVVLSTSPTITTPVFSGTITGTYTIGGTPTFPAEIAQLTSVQTLTNKTLTAPTITGIVSGTITSASITTMTGDVVGNVTGNVSGTAANVTGTVAVANGGTGQTTYTDGQLLIGNTTGGTLVKATLIAGDGISITNGAGSITVTSTLAGGTVTSVTGTGTVQGLTLSGTVTASGNITLGGSLSAIDLTSQVTNNLPVANGGTGRATSTTAYGIIAAGTTATGAHQTLAAGLTTEILVGGGVSALPVWTAATGSGAPVRATSASLTTPTLTNPTVSGSISGTITAATITTMTGNVTGNVSGTAANVTGTVAVANGGTGRTTSTTAYGLIAAGTTATGAHQTLAAGLTTQILVGGGASALPVWTAAEGSGAPLRAVSPTLTTPNIGVATATSVNKLAITPPATGATLAIADGKTLTCSNSLTFTGTDAASIAFGAGGTVIYVNGALGTPSSVNLSNGTSLPIITGTTGTLSVARGGTGVTSSTGSGNNVLSVNPTLTNPNYSAQTLTDAATIAWNTNSGSVATVTIGATRTMGSPSNLQVGTYVLHVIQGGAGGFNITWPAVFKWPGGAAPVLSTAAGARDVISFISDGTNLYGSYIRGVA